MLGSTRRVPLLAFAALVSGCEGPPPKVALPPPPAPPTAVVSATPAPPAAPEPTAFVVRGRILGHDGMPLKLAHAHVEDRVVAADAGGGFTITASAKGFLPVRFTGVDHAPHTIGIFFDGQEVEVEVTLGTYARYDGNFEDARALIHLRGKEGEPLRQIARGRFTKQLDGTYLSIIDARADEMLCSFENVALEHEVNCPTDDGVEHFSDGAYFGVLRPRGKKKIVMRFDPAKMPWSRRAKVVFADPTSRAARIAELWAGAGARTQAGAAARADHAAWRAEIAKAMAGERDADVAAAMRMAYLLPAITLDRKSEAAVSVARWLLKSIPPDAPIWAFAPEAALTVADLASTTPAADAWLDKLGDALRRRGAAAGFLAERVRHASLAGREDELARLFAMLKERFADTAAAKNVAPFAPTRKVRPGREIPDFDLPLLADGAPRGARITRASLRGKVVLIDFWATWCVPCIKEMRHLHAVHARNEARGFTILSVASRDRVASIRNFRARWRMPWSHVVLDDKNQDDTTDLFEVKSYPSPILVDADGKIVAIGEDLRGDGLRRAVEVALAGK